MCGRPWWVVGGRRGLPMLDLGKERRRGLELGQNRNSASYELSLGCKTGGGHTRIRGRLCIWGWKPTDPVVLRGASGRCQEQRPNLAGSPSPALSHSAPRQRVEHVLYLSCLASVASGLQVNRPCACRFPDRPLSMAWPRPYIHSGSPPVERGIVPTMRFCCPAYNPRTRPGSTSCS